jgi:hemolysin III
VSNTAGVAARLKPADIGKPRMRGWLDVYAFFIAIAASTWAPILSVFN